MNIRSTLLSCIVALAVTIQCLGQQAAGPSAPDGLLGRTGKYLPADESRENMISLGATLSGAYYRYSSDRFQDEGQLFVAPTLEMQHNGSKVDWGVAYIPAFSVHSEVQERNKYVQHGAGSLGVTFSPRLSLQLTEDYALSTNGSTGFLRGAQWSKDLSGFGGGNVNPVIFPDGESASNFSQASVLLRTSEFTTLGLSGTYEMLDYNGLGRGASLSTLGSESARAGLFFSRQYAASRSLGIQYEYLNLTQDIGDSRTRSHRVSVFHQSKLLSKGSLTLFAGAAYAEWRSIPISSASRVIWGTAFDHGMQPVVGVTYSWTGARLGIQCNYTRQVGLGSGLVAAPQSDTGLARAFYRFNTSTSAHLAMNVNDDRSLVAGNDSWMRTVALTAQIEKRLGQNLSVTVGYAPQWQQGRGTIGVIGDQQSTFISVSYRFTRPIGR